METLISTLYFFAVVFGTGVTFFVQDLPSALAAAILTMYAGWRSLTLTEPVDEKYIKRWREMRAGIDASARMDKGI